MEQLPQVPGGFEGSGHAVGRLHKVSVVQSREQSVLKILAALGREASEALSVMRDCRTTG
jgi:hypothetical protein